MAMGCMHVHRRIPAIFRRRERERVRMMLARRKKRAEKSPLQRLLEDAIVMSSFPTEES